MATDRAAVPAASEPAASGSNAEFDELLSAATGQVTAAGRPPRSALAAVLWLLALLPGAALALLLSMAVRVRLNDGAWPLRNQPDPKDLGLHNSITVVAILASFVAVLLVPLLALGAYFLGYRRIPVKAPVVAVVSLAILFIVLVADLGGLGEWIGD